MFKKKETFRKSALEKLASPERLDEMMRITSPKGWIALGTCGILLTLAIVWSIFGRIPERVAAQGMLIPGGANLPVEASQAGTITKYHVAVGDIIEDKQIIADINVGTAKFTVEQLKQRFDELSKAHAELEADETRRLADEADRKDRVIQAAASDQNAKIFALSKAREDLAKYRRLAAKGAVPRARVAEAEVAEKTAMADLEAARNVKSQQDSEFAAFKANIDRDRRTRQQEINDLQREIEKESGLMEANSRLESPYRGRVIELSAQVGTSVTEQDVVIRLEQVDESLVALLYAPPREGKKVEVGHTVQISPSTIKKEEFGSIKGLVDEKRNQPSTPEAMTSELGNSALVEVFSKSGPPLRIAATLTPNPDTESGYEWTSGNGPPRQIFSGTQIDASIIVGEKRPIDYVIPIFKNLVGGG